MKLNLKEGAYSIEKYNKAVIELLNKTDAHVVSFQDPETEDFVGMTVAVNGQEKLFKQYQIKIFLDELGVSEQTFQFVETSSPEERKEIERLALIKYHKSELQKLETNPTHL